MRVGADVLDTATLIGLASGVFLMVWAILQGGPLGDFIHWPSLAITAGGTIAATLIHYPLYQVLGVVKVVRHAFVRRPGDPNRLISLLVDLAEQARREGLLSLEDGAERAEDPLLRKGLQLVVDGSDPEQVRHILETEIALLEERHRCGAAVFETMSQLAPAFGLIGTLIGLVQMLRLTTEPDRVGPGMALALLTTLYGAVMGNFLFMPIAGKLKARSSEEILEKEMLVEGILAVQAGDGPRIIQEKLQCYVQSRQRSGNRGRFGRHAGVLLPEEEG